MAAGRPGRPSLPVMPARAELEPSGAAGVEHLKKESL